MASLKEDVSFFAGHSGTSPGNANSVRQTSCSLMGTSRRWIPLRWPPLQRLGNTTWWVVTEKMFVADIGRSNPRESSDADYVDAVWLLNHFRLFDPQRSGGHRDVQKAGRFGDPPNQSAQTRPPHHQQRRAV